MSISSQLIGAAVELRAAKEDLEQTIKTLSAKLAAAEAELNQAKADFREAHTKLLDSQAELSTLMSWLDQKIAEAKEQSKKGTPFDFERGSDLLAYIAVKNWISARKEQGKTTKQSAGAPSAQAGSSRSLTRPQG